jgi:hypothetical protein
LSGGTKTHLPCLNCKPPGAPALSRTSRNLKVPYAQKPAHTMLHI